MTATVIMATSQIRSFPEAVVRKIRLMPSASSTSMLAQRSALVALRGASSSSGRSRTIVFVSPCRWLEVDQPIGPGLRDLAGATV